MADERTAAYPCECLDGGHDVGDGVHCMCGGVMPRARSAASRHDNPDQWVSGGHEKFETPAIPIRDGEHPAAKRDAEQVEAMLKHTRPVGSAASTPFDVPAVKEALWLLLGGGLDETGKEKWLAWRLEMGFGAEEIFTQALRQIDGQVAA